MSFSAVKEAIIELSGRRDFEANEKKRTRLNWFINTAQLQLDFNNFDFVQSKGVDIREIYAGMGFVTIQNCKAIDRIRVIDINGDTEVDFRTYNRTELLDNLGENVFDIKSHDGTVKIDVNGHVIGDSSTTFKDDAVTSADLFLLPNNSGGAWSLLGTAVVSGTVSIAVLGDDGIVTGVDTSFDTLGVVAGDLLVIAGVAYQVTVVDVDDVSLTIRDQDGTAYTGGVKSGVDYSIITLTHMNGTSYSGGAITEAAYFYVFNSSATKGRPILAAPNIIRIAPGSSFPLPEIGSLDLVNNSGGGLAYNGLILYPPPDGTYTLRIEGDFYSKTLSLDADVSFWTEHNGGSILVAETLKLINLLEMRNRSAADTYDFVVQDQVRGLQRAFTVQKSRRLGKKVNRRGSGNNVL